jgi:hypothetical protein
MAWTTWHATMGCSEASGTKRAAAMPGFEGAPWGVQEISSLGTALDPKLEAGRPRAAPSPRIPGVLCAYW